MTTGRRTVRETFFIIIVVVVVVVKKVIRGPMVWRPGSPSACSVAQKSFSHGEWIGQALPGLPSEDTGSVRSSRGSVMGGVRPDVRFLSGFGVPWLNGTC